MNGVLTYQTIVVAATTGAALQTAINAALINLSISQIVNVTTTATQQGAIQRLTAIIIYTPAL